MVGQNNLCLGMAFRNCLFDKGKATLMLGVEILCIEAVTFILDAVEITHATFDYKVYIRLNK